MFSFVDFLHIVTLILWISRQFHQMSSKSQAVSGILGAIGVACGAFGAHGLKNHTSDPALLESWKTAASYQMLHVTLQKPRWDWGGWRIAYVLQIDGWKMAPTGWDFFFVAAETKRWITWHFQVSNEKKPGVLLYKGDYIYYPLI